MVFEYLFNSLDYETKVRLQSPKNLKLRGLASSDFKVKFPLEPTHNRSSYKAISITPLASPEKVLVGLLWTAMFGKNFRVYHWLLLLELLLKTINSKGSEAILKILCLLTTENSGQSWNQKYKPMKTLLGKRLSAKDCEREIQDILKNLPFQLPHKDPIIENLVQMKVVDVILKKPKEIRRIGVGYKDKGTLPSGNTPEPLDSEFLFDLEDRFFVLVAKLKQDPTYKNLF
jgi:hypothetical protein